MILNMHTTAHVVYLIYIYTTCWACLNRVALRGRASLLFNVLWAWRQRSNRLVFITLCHAYRVVRPEQNGLRFLDDNFNCISSKENFWLNFWPILHWSLCPLDQLTVSRWVVIGSGNNLVLRRIRDVQFLKPTYEYTSMRPTVLVS